jgi:hypothetical protein
MDSLAIEQIALSRVSTAVLDNVGYPWIRFLRVTVKCSCVFVYTKSPFVLGRLAMRLDKIFRPGVCFLTMQE